MAGPVILIMGPPGAGKSSQARRLGGRDKFVHISTGDLLRGSGDAEIQKMMNEGDLVDPRKVEELLLRQLVALPVETGLVLDGFPREMVEADWLEQELPKLNRQISKVVLLVIDQKESERRNLLRGRQDDSLEAQKERWKEWREMTEPVLNKYRQLGLVAEVDGMGTPDEVAELVAAAVE